MEKETFLDQRKYIYNIYRIQFLQKIYKNILNERNIILLKKIISRLQGYKNIFLAQDFFSRYMYQILNLIILNLMIRMILNPTSISINFAIVDGFFIIDIADTDNVKRRVLIIDIM